jgi:hypothetical protein
MCFPERIAAMNTYGKMTDEDLRTIFASLKTVPPIENAPPQTVVAPPPGT